MKRIFLSESQINYINTIESTKDVFPEKFTNKLFEIGKNNSISNFKDDISNIPNKQIINEYLKVISSIKKIETPIINQLEKLCYNILIECFNIPNDEIHFNIELVNEIERGKEFHVTPDTNESYEYDNIDSINEEDKEVNKRKIVNLFVYGATDYVFSTVLKNNIEKIFELDEELPHLYSKFMKLNEYILYTNKIQIDDNNTHQGGFSKITLGNDNFQPQIEIQATIFPILLFETIKGVLELISSNGLPDNISETNNVLNKADILQLEPYNMCIGKPLFITLLNDKKIDTHIIPLIINNLSTTDTKTFLKLFDEISNNTKLGKESFQELVDNCEYTYEYSEFNDDILKKHNDNSIVTDSYYTSSELNEDAIDEATYPSQFSMDDFKSIKSFAGRVRYCEMNLQRISSGSSRIVYKIDENTVLKLAKNRKGIAQNENEASDSYLQSYGCFANIYDVDENYLWIEMQLAKKAKPSDFKRLTGYSFRFMQNFIAVVRSQYSRNSGYIDPLIKQEIEKLYNSDNFEYSLFDEVYQYLSDYTIDTIGDLQRISSWGVVSDNGTERLVIIDYGLTDDTFEQYYKR